MSERKFDPRQPYTVWLDSFEDVPEAERPTFTYRRTSGAEHLQIVDAAEILVKEDSTPRQRYEAFFTAARVGMIGWTNQVDLQTGEAIEFDIAKLDAVINHEEAYQLASKRRNHGMLSPDDKKKSESPPSSVTDS